MKKEQMPLRPSLTELSDKMQRTTRANAVTMLHLDAERLNEINVTKPIAKQKWKHAIVTVGGGRGFIVEGKDDIRFIITAGHCLPQLPDSFPAAGTDERTYHRLIGRLDAEPTISAECIFVDPVSDVAVLAAPDSQEFSTEAEEYETLVTTCQEPLQVGGFLFDQQRRKFSPALPAASNTAWLMSLKGKWFSCNISSRGRGLWITDATDAIRGGMSGSPIMAAGGAIGVVSVAEGKGLEGGPNPELAVNLPVWIARTLTP
ncbi:MAG: serine protease [Rhodopila sp.]|jgi:hypothetical protein